MKSIRYLKFEKDYICDTCQLGKQTKSSFKPIKDIMTSRPLELIHMDLFGLAKTKSLNGNRYVLVLVDDFSRFTWIFFLEHKDQTFLLFNIFQKRVEKEKEFSILRIRSDRGGEFVNQLFMTYCDENGIKHEKSCLRTPQQNGVVERKNRTLQEMSRTMISEYGLPQYLWAEAVNLSLIHI